MFLCNAAIAVLVSFAAAICCNAAPVFQLADSTNYSVVAIGGNTCGSGCPTAAVELYSLANNKSQTLANMPQSDVNFGSTVYNNIIYVVGGDGPKNYFWSYNVATNMWSNSTLPAIVKPTQGNGLVALGGVLYSIAGSSKSVFAYNITDAANGGNATWQTLPNQLPADFNDICAVVVNNSIYYMSTGSFYRSDDMAQTWTKLKGSNQNRFDTACVVLPNNSAIMSIGGRNGGSGQLQKATEIYDIPTDTWKTVANLKETTAGMRAVVLPGTQQVVACGGWTQDNDHTPTHSCEVYDIPSNTWSGRVGSTLVKRTNFGLHVVTN